MENQKNRLTFVEQVYCQDVIGEEPMGFSNNFSTRIDAENPPYSRSYNLKEVGEWEKLDTGWIDSPGFILIESLQKRLQKTPTEEEQKTLDNKVLQIAFHSDRPELEIQDGQCLRLRVPLGGEVYVRSSTSHHRIKVVIFPR